MLRSKLLLAGCALALTLPACVENETSLFVGGVLKLKAPECEVRADQGTARLTSGILDVGFTTTYQAELLVGLQLATRGDKSKLRAESMNFQVRGAEVRLTNSVGDLVEEFSVPSGGWVAPTNSNTPGFGIAEVILVPNSVGERLQDDLSGSDRRTLVAEVRVFGDTLGGADLTSGSFNYVIEICNGCLSRYVEDGIIPGAQRSVCNDALTEPLIDNGCFFGQDGTFDCRYCVTTECSTFGD